MSLRSNTQLKLVGAASAALMIAGAVASPALAAPVTVNYTCGPVAIPMTFDVGTLPTSLVAGQKVTQSLVSGSVHLDQTAVGVAQSQGWTSVSGTATGTGSDGATPYNLTIPQTAVPATPGATLDIPATGAFKLAPTKAGTYTVSAGASTAFIQGYNASGPANSITLPCTPPTDGSNVLGTISVSKDKTKTTPTATFSSTKHMVKGKAKVKSHFGLKPTGKVKFTLMRGTQKVGPVQKIKVNAKGVAKGAMWMNVTKHGKYTLKAKYLGNNALKTSAGTTTFKVS